MILLSLATLLSVVAWVQAINRPVYKIVLTQKGYTQFLQYDIEIPPLREFTFCTWIRVFDLENDQSIFTYVANGNNRVLRLWLDSGGRHMRVVINGKESSKIEVNVVKDVWRHVCLSYQTDYGAWALYIDSRLATCQTYQSLYGFVLPGSGSVIIGYGTSVAGATNGFEGEIFGANMILSSTIESNHTMRSDPKNQQKRFLKNKLNKVPENINEYVVLSNLSNDEIHNTFEKPNILSVRNTTKSYVHFQTPHSFVDHEVGLEQSNKASPTNGDSAEHEIFDLTVPDLSAASQGKIVFQNGILPKSPEPKTEQSLGELSNSDTKEVPNVSEYETPPPPTQSIYFDKSLLTKEPSPESIYKLKDSSTSKYGKIVYNKKTMPELSDMETPPPPTQNSKVYGQWTSSKFAGSVLKYLKSINYKNRDQLIRKVPQTIPLHKLSDSHPYPSEFKISKLRPPSEFKRRNIIEKRFDVIKRDPQINVQILEDDIRNSIIKAHAETRPKIVEITNRGEPMKKSGHKDHRFYRNAQFEQLSDEKVDKLDVMYNPKRVTSDDYNKVNNHRHFSKTKPFIKSLQYLGQDTEREISTETSDMYIKSLSNANKWHNVKSYNNDYTPRKININFDDTMKNKKLYPAVRIKYVPEKNQVLEDEDQTILNGRRLAQEVSGQSSLNHNAVSLFKYNHGYLPNHDNMKVNDRAHNKKSRIPSKRDMEASSFNNQVKIGNALNERVVLGNDDYQKKQSFEGGYDNIPDIHRYRSNLDDENGGVPPSLGPKVCKNSDNYDRFLYVQLDESIDMTFIVSPLRRRNIAIDFVMENYKKCSLTDSPFQKNIMLLIDWSKTPVRLFGGAYPKTTTDLCGFF